MRFEHPDIPDAVIIAAVEILQILVVWVLAIQIYKWLDVARARFNPREFWAWLQTPEGSFAEYVARDTREDRSNNPEADDG